MDERISSDEESFEFIDVIGGETKDYVLPDIVTEQNFGNESLVDENRPDHNLFVQSLNECKVNIDEGKLLFKKSVKKDNICLGVETKDIVPKVKKINDLKNDNQILDSSLMKDKNIYCSNSGEETDSEFHKFNHFSVDQSVNEGCKICTSGDEFNKSVLCPKKQISSQSRGNSSQKGGILNENCVILNKCSCDSEKQSTRSNDGSFQNNLENKSAKINQSGDNSSHCCAKGMSDAVEHLHKKPSGQNLGLSSEANRPSQSSHDINAKEKRHQNLGLSSETNSPSQSSHDINVKEERQVKKSLHLDCSKTLTEGDKLQDGLLSPSFRREKPLSKEEFQKMFDEDGRLVDEHALRKAVFMGGVDPSIRKEVWHFLFGFFPCSSTAREREDLLIDYIMKYHEQKSRWKTMLMLNAKPGASLLEQGLVARYQIDTSNNSARSPDCDMNDPISEFEILQNNLMAGKKKTGDPDFKSLSKSFPNLNLTSPELKQKIDFMKIQAQVLVNRHNVNVKDLWSQLRVIDKDVPRTDRDQDYFKGPLNPNLSVLRDILLTFSAFYPKIGYAQGMNDILARFLVVFDSEVETYWCFSIYMTKIQEDFTEAGMVRKIELVVELLEEMDLELLQHLRQHDQGDLMFCHRWLLLGFKREMSFLDSLRCFEILSSHHLELSSLEAENARRKQTMKEFENLGGVTRTARMDTECEYTFELFVCLALLEECRDELLQSTDTAAVFTVINNVKIDLDDILCKSADLFYKYCKKSVDDSFLMVELPLAMNRKHRSVFR